MPQTLFPNPNHATYFSPTIEEHQSRIDYWLVPQSFFWAAKIKRCRPLHKLGEMVQLVRAARPTDHKPVELVADICLDFSGPEQHNKHFTWDYH